MTFLHPPDDGQVVYEFFAPFAHVPGRHEWCRIRSPTHGVFDCFILLGGPRVVVYVASDEGERFMAERYPECEAHRVPPEDLVLHEQDGGRTLAGELRAHEGPVRLAEMTIRARSDAAPRAVPYGGDGKPVWGSRRWTCWGVDLALDAHATGVVERAGGPTEELLHEPAIVTLGSFGRIAPL